MTFMRGRAWPLVLTLWTQVGTGCGEIEKVVGVSYDDRFAATAADVYLPAPASEAPPGGWPAVLAIHGGGWRHFDRSSMAAASERLAGAGYVVMNIDYRLVPAGQYPAAVQDSLCALAYLRANAAEWGVDPERIATYGYSAGGHLASMVGVATAGTMHQPDCEAAVAGGGGGGGGGGVRIAPPAAVVSGAGPEDMWLFPEAEAVVDFVGGKKAEVPELWDAASPITYVDAAAEAAAAGGGALPPFLFVHGEEDWFAGIEHSEHMRDALEAVGGQAELFSIPGGGHLINRDTAAGRYDLIVTSTDTAESWIAMVDFLDRTIGGAR
ncbi:MAG TPA: alpha/beta hydrolase [Kofleriaceae bacterium]|nr:alpha/beta hydrolase [Kofleriaceae bacterium]